MKKFKKILSVALTIIIFTGLTSVSYNASSNTKSVYLGGEPFGVKFHSNGVIIINMEDFYDGNRYVCPAKKGGLKISDIITAVNGNQIKSNEDLKTAMESSNGSEMEFDIKRDGKDLKKTIIPAKNTIGIYLLGAWVRDSCAGIGTITYYDTENNYFAALGHGICDYDTSTLLPLASGEVVNANISGVNKSVTGKAGSLNGYFSDNMIGKLIKNTKIGIYGTINDNFQHNKRKYEIADKNDIKVGKALLYTTINDKETGCYDIEIERICNKSSNSNENFVIKITDEELLDACGGIVQGMSGSPIIQNEKIVGAVTHVFVNSPDEGYGIILQNMVDNFRN